MHVGACGRHINETVTLRKQPTKYKHLDGQIYGWSNLFANLMVMAIKLLTILLVNNLWQIINSHNQIP